MRALVRSRTASEDHALNSSSRPNLSVHSPRPNLDSFKEKQSPVTSLTSATANLTPTAGYSIMRSNYYTQPSNSQPSVYQRSCSSNFRLWSCLVLTIVGLIFLLNWEVLDLLLYFTRTHTVLYLTLSLTLCCCIFYVRILGWNPEA